MFPFFIPNPPFSSGLNLSYKQNKNKKKETVCPKCSWHYFDDPEIYHLIECPKCRADGTNK